MKNQFIKSDSAHEKLYLSYKEKEPMGQELSLAHEELSYLYEEKAKRAAELVIANQELVFQKKEKAKRAVELVIAHRALDYQKLEMNVRDSELFTANKKLVFKTQERQLKAAELNVANRELMIFQQKQIEYIEGLEEMMFMTSHKVRQPIANILGLSNVLDQFINSPEELKQVVCCIKEAALSLDLYTRELTDFMHKLGKKEDAKSVSE